MLAVNPLTRQICDGKNLLCILARFARIVDFQLNPEIPRTAAVENRLGLVVVLVDDRVVMGVVTVGAVRLTVDELRSVTVHQRAAVLAEIILSFAAFGA